MKVQGFALWLGSLAACWLTCSEAFAAPPVSINFTNPGFEDQSLADNGVILTIDDWDTDTGFHAGLFNPPSSAITPETNDGSSNVVFFRDNGGSIQQNLVDGSSATLNTAPNQVWVFDFDLGRRGDTGGDGTPTLTAALRTGGADVVTAARDRNHQTGGNGADASDGSWNANSVALFTGVSPTEGPAELQFRQTSATNHQTLLDAVSGRVYENMNSINLANAGFETDVLTNGAFNTDVAGWTESGGTAGAFNPSATNITGEAYGGENTVFLNSGGQISQALTLTGGDDVELFEGQTFLVNLAIGDRSDIGGTPGTLTLDILDELGNVVGTTTSNPLTEIDPDSWGTQTFEIDIAGLSAVGDQATLRFTNNGNQILLDDISAFASFNSAAVPEPTSIAIWTIFGVLGGTCAVRHRRRKKCRKLGSTETSAESVVSCA